MAAVGSSVAAGAAGNCGEPRESDVPGLSVPGTRVTGVGWPAESGAGDVSGASLADGIVGRNRAYLRSITADGVCFVPAMGTTVLPVGAQEMEPLAGVLRASCGVLEMRREA
jgi:hypothetical protein